MLNPPSTPALQADTRAGGGDKGVSRWRCLFLGCLCALKSSSAAASCSLVAALSSGSTHARSRRRWVGLGRPTHPLRALESRCCRCSDLCAACCASRDAGGGRGGRQGEHGGARRGPGRGELRVALAVVGGSGIGAWHGLSSTLSATSTTSSSPTSPAAPHTSATVKSTLSSPPPPPAAAAIAADAAAAAASSSPSLPAAFAAKCCCCCCVCCMSLSLSPTCASSTAKREAAD